MDILERRSQLSPEKRVLLEKLLRGQAAADAGGIPRRPAGSRARLSFSQERLWFLDRLLPGTPAYNVPGVVRLRGDLDSSALEASLAEVVRRHEALRTVFLDEGGAVVQETAPAGPFELPRVDLRPLGAEEREIEVRRLALEEARGSFDLGRADRGPLLRARLLRLADDEHLLLLCLHHIAADGWSVGVLLSELATLYEAFRASRPSPLPPLPLQYADFAEWQRERLQGETLDELLRFWKELLAGSPQALDLPTDHPRPAVQSFRGARWPFHVEEGVADAVRALAREERTTPFGVLLAVFEVFLSRWAGQRELLVGSPVAGRSRAELHGLIGFFVNTLVYRGELADDPSVRRLVERTGAQAVAVLAHQELPFERLVAELRPDRSLSHSPLVQAMFVFQNAPTASVALPGLTLERLNVDNGTAKFDLTLEIADGTPALAGWLEFSLDLFEPATAERMVQGFQHLLRIAMAQPDRSLSELDPLGEEERQQLLYAWNGSGTPQVEETACLHELFAAQAARTPGAPALDYGSEEISYDELAHRAGELARHLSGLGVGPETLVGLCCRRTPEMVAAMLGILKAGGAYVPLDPNYPEAVLRGMLEEAKVELVLAEESFVSLLLTSGVRIVPLEGAGSGGDTGEALSPCRCAPTPENLAYLIFTSGSTGHPKAVAIQHRSAAALLRWAAGRFAPEELDGVLASTSICFDLSVFEIFLPLSLGGRIVLAGNALELPSLPARNRVRLVNTVPSAIAELVRAGALPASVRTVNLAGEPLSRALVDQVYGAASVERVWNLYGPSEDTTYSTATLVPAGTAEPPTIGRPIAGTRLYLLDADLLPVPRGARGEICLGGAGLARGYLHRPERTAERFIPDAWSGLPGERLYRTGDLGRLRLDGEVEFLGRVDRQVKIRGFRVEPGEIEAALRRHPAVGEAVVLARADGPGPKRLVAYVTGAEGARPCPPAEMRSFLSGRLPEHMLPSALVWLDAFPLTPNGKIDWRRLPAPDERPAELAYTPPRTPTEELLAELWADVLGLERVGVEDDFFALGGHSLLATRVVSGVRRAFGVELPLRSLFEAPTVAALAARFDALQQPAAERRLPGLAPVAPRPEHPPLSFAQERLWFLDQYEPGSGAWNLPSVLRLRGRLDHAAFEAALEELVRRHEALRTAVDVVDGRPVQRVAPAAGVPLPGIDLGALPADVREAELARLTVREAAAPFDLTAAPLLRARLVRLGGQEHALLLNLHHIAADGWSIQILIREIGALYTAFAGGLAPALPELPVQYVDYALWQRELVSGELLEGQLAYWTQRLAGAPDLLDLPTDFQRPAVQTFTGGRASLTLPAELAGSLRSLGRGAGATFFMTLLAAFEVVLARWSGEDDILVGIPIAGRTRAEVEGLIGCFLNTLVLRTDLSGNPDFLTVLRRVRETTLEAYSHQDLPFERLLEAVRPQRDLSRTPLFQVFFNMLNYPESEIRLPGLEVELLALPEVPSKFDLTVYLAERDGGLAIDLVYNADLFSARRAADLLAQMERVLAHAAGAPEVPVSRCSLVTAAMAERLPDPAAPLSDAWHGSVHERFERQARRVPANLAVSDSRERWTYAELDARSNQLAHVLVSSGVRPGEVVALYAHRSATLVWAVLGVLKAGAAFLLIDPVYPARRTVACLRIASPRGWLQLAAAGPEPAEIAVALDELPLACRLELAPRGKGPDPLAGSPEHSPGISVGPDDLAYVAFTSGSTGTPKGILGRQGPLSHFLPWQEREFGFGEEDRFSMLSGLSHDPLHRDLFTPLQLGAAICVPDPESLGEPGWLARWMAREEVTVTHLTPAMGQLLTEPAPGGETVTVPSLRWALLVGDALTRSDVARLERLAPRITCVNLYGSTETQRAVGYHVVQRGESATSSAREILPLGRGIEDVQLLVLNRAGDLAGLGELGEVALRSPHLAAGYLGLPELTAERFVVNPWTGEPGDRLYRTGDLGRYLPDGEVASAGRADQQVKIRGFRVEPGEIEAALARHPAVLEAAVIAAEDGGGERRLAAYVVPRPEPGGVALSVAELRAFLAERVPDYMVPAAFAVLAALPLTPNGKLDRRALPAPVWGGRGARGYEPPRNPTEEALAEIWCEVLGRERIGVHDNFFELGGHSLLATQVVSRVRETLRRELPLRGLFAAPTVAALAERLEDEARPSAPPILRASRKWDLPLSFSQQRLWYLDQLQPGSPTYHIPAAVRLRGRLEAPVLEAALRQLVARQESLRTRFLTAEGRPVQVVVPEVPVALPRVDLTGVPEAQSEDLVRELASVLFLQPFDLRKAPLLRPALLRLSDTEHALVVVFHHIVVDGWSLAVFFRELSVLYRALAGRRRPDLPPLAIQYADFAVWQREWVENAVLVSQLPYWKERLGVRPARLELPTDRTRPTMASFRGARRQVALGRALTSRLKDLSAGRRATLFMTLVAGFKTLLHRLTEQTDIVIGTAIANRNRREIEGLVGMFFNLLALRTDLGGNPAFDELIERVREVALGAYAHQDLPFEKLLEELQPEREMSRTPLFQVTAVLQNAPLSSIELPDLCLEPFPVESGTANFELNLQMTEGPDGLVGILEYRTDLFDGVTIARLGEHWVRLLEGAVEDPRRRLLDLPLLSDGERAQLIREWNDTSGTFPADVLMHELFETQAERSPERVAVLCAGQEWSYGELDARADRLARYLRSLGVGPGSLVGVHLSRSAEMVLALLGVLKAGGAYVPLETSYPEARLHWIVERLGIRQVLTQHRHTARLLELGPLPELRTLVCLDEESNKDDTDPRVVAWSELAALPAGPPERLGDPDDPAYIIFTSGSTGSPKGVLVRHRPAVNLIDWVNGRFAMGESDRVLFLTSLSFDLSVYDVFGLLAAGGSVRVALEEEVGNPEALVRILETEPITFWDSAPAALQQLVPFFPASSRGHHLRLVFQSGDWIPVGLPDQVRAAFPGTQVISLGGATEATVWSNFFPIETVDRRWVSIPYGRPIRNARYHVLDRELNPCAAGVAGDLYIGGGCLSWGYFGEPELTARKFIPDPFAQVPGDVLYATGDRARYWKDGNLEFLGRLDHQVKIRGFRIELGEIESTLAAHPAVRDAVVLAREDNPGDKRLVAYVVPDPRGLAEGETGGADDAQLSQWQRVYDEVYAQPAASADPTFNIVGWNSSYTGQPLPEAEMREWVEQTVGRILSLRPRRVLEIGCGTGLLLFRVAPHCVEYRGTDLSEAGLRFLETQIEIHAPELRHVSLWHRAADDWTGIEPGSFDTIVLNSVSQHFPDAAYLRRVVEGAVAALAPGGTLFIGDVRSLPHLAAFHASVQLHQAPDGLARKQLFQRVQQRMSHEEELVVAPSFFHALRREIPAISSVQIQLKRGRHHNEMNRFRYDAFLRVGGEVGERPEPRWLDWQGAGLGLPRLRELLLAERPESLGLRDVPNARLQREGAILDWLGGDRGPETAGAMRELLPAAADRGGVDPEDLWALAAELCYGLDVVWAEDGFDRFHALFVRRSEAQGAPVPAEAFLFPEPPLSLRPSVEHANDPLTGTMMRRLVPALREHLTGRLPEYMIPSAFVLLESLPVTASGKLDRRALPPPDSLRPELGREYTAPRNEWESRLAEIWSQVLGVEHVGVHDNFFELGGDSILSIQVIARAASFGLRLTPRQLFNHQTIAELAAVAVSAEGPGTEQGEVTGPVPLTPIQRWFFAQEQPDPQHWNLAVLLAPRRRLAGPLLDRVVARLLAHHDALRLRFTETPAGWAQENAPAGGPAPFHQIDLSLLPPERQRPAMEEAAASLQASLHLGCGPLMRVALFDLDGEADGSRQRLLLILHHLVVDGVSWRILLEDLQEGYLQLVAGAPLELPAKTSSYRAWAEGLAAEVCSPVSMAERERWLKVLDGAAARLPVDFPGGANLEASSRVVSVSFSAEETQALLRELPEQHRLRVPDLLVTALAETLAGWTGGRSLLMDMESHGREEIGGGLDLSRTVGWCTSIFPVRLDLPHRRGPGETLAIVKEELRSVPRQGIGYGLMRYLADDEEILRRLEALPHAEVVFNYLGRFDAVVAERSLFSAAAEPYGPIRSGRARRHHVLEVYGQIVDGLLHIDFEYSENLHRRATIEGLTRRFAESLRALFAHFRTTDVGGLTPSDFPEADLSQDELERLLAEL